MDEEKETQSSEVLAQWSRRSCPASLPTPTLCQLARPFCRHQLPSAVSKVRFPDLSAQISGSARVSCCSLKALLGSRLASTAAFGIKKCKNILVAAICELVGSLEPRSRQPASHPPEAYSAELGSGEEGQAVAYRIIVKTRAKKASASVPQMIKELVFLSQNFLDPLAGTIWIVAFCVVLRR
ncbi:unnamed protein product [Rangifer tarandus platyrhynchus]|uniref:Uncharacterized protein n=1 Tax=Rangifer tarandus platyrhynchus TaxID=3082113 RepID=A0ABN8Y7Y9_RANTA|nr:unnamed protein product [Rangifer tarandus platyrhynchus]